MPRCLLAVLLLLARPLAAQSSFIAPDAATITGMAEAASTKAQTHLLFVANRSTVPIVVYALELSGCANVVQPCERTATAVTIAPGARGQIGRINATVATKRPVYQWTFAYRPDTTDATVVALLREHGLLPPVTTAANLAALAAADTITGLATASGDARAPLTTQERTRKVVLLDAQNRPVAASARYRFKVAQGSILGSTTTPGAAVLATGACIDPAELARFDEDTTIHAVPHPPTLTRTSIALPTLPATLRDSTARTGEVVARWVVDSTGDALPGSVGIKSSPHGLMSVSVCGAVIGSHLVAGRDEAGQPVRSWVELSLRFTH